MGITFNDVSEELPLYGEPVLTRLGTVVQNITYIRDADSEESVDWFEPYYFEHESMLKIPAAKISGWVYVQDLNAE